MWKVTQLLVKGAPVVAAVTGDREAVKDRPSTRTRDAGCLEGGGDSNGTAPLCSGNQPVKIVMNCYLPSTRSDSVKVHRQATALVGRLSQAHADFSKWWVVPDGPKDPYIPLDDADAVSASIRRSDRRFFNEFPSAESNGSIGVLLANSESDKQWRERGKVFLSVKPALGRICLEISRVSELYATPGDVVWSLLKVLSSDPRVTFANTNIVQRVAEEIILYTYDRSFYQHREFLGWMGYVDKPLSADQLPQAARMEAQGRGTLILATEVLDLADHAAIEQTNRTEIGLAELGLLPVIDPSLW